MKNRTFFNSSGQPFEVKDILTIIKNDLVNDVTGKIHIGTDSHKTGSYYKYATAICLWGDGFGGKFFKATTKKLTSHIESLHHRLMSEVELSIAVANLLIELDSDITYDDILIHVDVNQPSSSHASGRSAESICNYVRAYGFSYVIKHDAWAASCVADHYTRDR